VSISYTEDEFKIIEYVHLGLNNQFKYYPLEEVVIVFQENGSYQMETTLIFEPPQFNKKTLYHIYNANLSVIEKLKKDIPLNATERKDIKNLPATYLICFLNDFTEAKDKLLEAKPFLKKLGGTVYDSYKESVRILRKMKYS
jgi:DNA polymerase III delta subunit